MSIKLRTTFFGTDVAQAMLSVALLYILFDVVVSLTYGATDTLLLLKEAPIPDAQEGNKLRQVLYIIAILVCGSIAIGSKRFSLPDFGTVIPFSYTVAIIWAISSSLWAIDPGISLRRSLLMFAILFPVCLAVQQLGTEKTVSLIYKFLATVLIVSYVSVILNKVPIFSFSIHPDGELDPAVSGAWRGVMSHKNGAGPVICHAAFIFFFHALYRRKPVDFVLFALSIVFIYFTKSKTSLGLLLVSIAIGLIYKYFVDRQALLIWKILLASFALCSMVLSVAGSDIIYTFFSDYQNLTGRVGIWTSMMFYIRENLWLGSGYGSFWGIGEKSPIFDLAVEDYITRLGTSHNGFIEILATTGIIGLGLVVFALIVMPFIRFGKAPRQQSAVYALFFTMWTFGILQNFTESQIFSPEKQSWIFVVIAMASVYSDQRRSKVDPPHEQRNNRTSLRTLNA